MEDKIVDYFGNEYESEKDNFKIFICIEDGLYIYEQCTVDRDGVHHIVKDILHIKHPTHYLEGPFVNYLMKVLKEEDNYKFRDKLIRYQSNQCGGQLDIRLQPTTKHLMDYNWNDRIHRMVREKSELTHISSWLSTLGGAYSALGDYFQECAETAAKISMNQFKLAMRLGDSEIVARCRLYLALSLIQRKQFKQAKRMIYNEYKQALSAIVQDIRLMRMCKGIWAKLQYEHFLYVQQKRNLKMKEIKCDN